MQIVVPAFLFSVVMDIKKAKSLPQYVNFSPEVCFFRVNMATFEESWNTTLILWTLRIEIWHQIFQKSWKNTWMILKKLFIKKMNEFLFASGVSFILATLVLQDPRRAR